MAAILKWLSQKCAQCDFYLLVYGDCVWGRNSSPKGCLLYISGERCNPQGGLNINFFLNVNFVSNEAQWHKLSLSYLIPTGLQASVARQVIVIAYHRSGVGTIISQEGLNSTISLTLIRKPKKSYVVGNLGSVWTPTDIPLLHNHFIYYHTFCFSNSFGNFLGSV